MKILMIDDHTVVRRGVCQLISSRVEVEFDEASSGQEGLQKIAHNAYDIVLLDISMPGRNGLEILKLMKASAPRLPVLILSMHPEEHYAVRALKNGASGYITKDCTPDELIAAVQQVAGGKKYISPNLQSLAIDALSHDSTEGNLHDVLSDREFQIASLIATGKTVGQIAEELSLSVQTISTYRARLLIKMNMKTNAELATYCIRLGIV
ncbi:MAG: response regulator transcription factor [Oryzomonas sp.]|uniref:response regulator transcription factor n=1 Tax=Oryzomonas sp. TaxID=2855186 RepID=UPI00283F87AE|nr:response regulator transcription factor [Oryzomonas sp.]MDR3580107.1 response regulator transcription factor [Oryzomonas sp.]